ncbi:bombyxin B-2 homolog [Armigeres subalbatus]|uniref:bombyxin B-2 homolog n=1 Tax=Armigeres subalbatus TaxID=124917 RepID=UPI002ED51625
MKPTFIVLLFLTMLLITNVSARAVRRSCGKYLADRISDLCKVRGGYSQLGSVDGGMQPYRRRKRGIVDECCKQSCTDAALMQYCMEQVEEPEEVVTSNEESKPTTPATTEKIVKQPLFTTKFPFNTLPMEFGTVRPEFYRINAKYMGSKRKQYYHIY